MIRIYERVSRDRFGDPDVEAVKQQYNVQQANGVKDFMDKCLQFCGFPALGGPGKKKTNLSEHQKMALFLGAPEGGERGA